MGGEEGDAPGDGDAERAVPEECGEPEAAGRQGQAELRVPDLGREVAGEGQAQEAAAAAQGRAARHARVVQPAKGVPLHRGGAAGVGEDGPDRPAAQLSCRRRSRVPPRAALRQAHQGALRPLPRPLPLPAREAREAQHRPDSLLPELPKPAELRPFPERHSFSFSGHRGKRVYALSSRPTARRC